jgi:hypothetical protein
MVTADDVFVPYIDKVSSGTSETVTFIGDITSYTDDMLFVSNPIGAKIVLLNYSKNLIENAYEY